MKKKQLWLLLRSQNGFVHSWSDRSVFNMLIGSISSEIEVVHLFCKILR